MLSLGLGQGSGPWGLFLLRRPPRALALLPGPALAPTSVSPFLVGFISLVSQPVSWSLHSCDTSLPSPLAGTLFPQPFKRLARFPEARPWHPHPSAQGLRDSFTVCLPLKRGPHDAPSCQRLTQPGVVEVEKGLIQ